MPNATDTTPAPSAAFDPAGTPAIISYQVPEPTSYAGAHVLTLNYDLSDFADVAAAPSTAENTPSTGDAGGQDARLEAADTTSGSAADAVTAPRSVVLGDPSVPTDPIIVLAPFPLSDRLAALVWSNVQAAQAAGKHVQVFRSIAGQLDYRVRELSAAPLGPLNPASTPAALVRRPSLAFATTAKMSATLRAAPALRARNGGGEGGDIDPVPRPYLSNVIQTPDASNPVVRGPWNGLQLAVAGVSGATQAGLVEITVELRDAQKTVVASAKTVPVSGHWSVTLPVTASGAYSVFSTAVGSMNGLRAGAAVAITVALDSPPSTPPATPPSVQPVIRSVQPDRNAVLTAPDGNVLAPVSGTVDTLGGSALTVRVAVDSDEPGDPLRLTPGDGTLSTFATNALLSGDGMHSITVSAVNDDGVAAPALTVPIRVAETAPYRPLDRRLVIIEKVAISAFLGDYGASRLIKTFSLLPGEETTISVETYTKSEATSKAAASILDSAATECAADFEDSVNSENDSKTTSSSARSNAISVDIGAGWGWGHADIRGAHTDAANSSRENMAKTVLGALNKHTSKASSNRSVTINTETTQTTSTGSTESTKRTLKNINVSRVLNFVFRQMSQRHHVAIHLTDATIGLYKRDLMLAADNTPQKGPDGGPVVRETFEQYSLPEVGALAATEMTGTTVNTLQQDILNVLSSIPDAFGVQQSLVEVVTPTAEDGTPREDAAYLRVKPNFTQQITTTSGSTFTVPGIVLGTSDCVLRTDQVLCDALLGEGNALDGYSHALQDVAIAERQAAVAERSAAVAREQLAQKIVTTKDLDMAAAWQKVYPQPLSVPATVTVPTTRDLDRVVSGVNGSSD